MGSQCSIAAPWLPTLAFHEPCHRPYTGIQFAIAGLPALMRGTTSLKHAAGVLLSSLFMHRALNETTLTNFDRMQRVNSQQQRR
jgi:hypothetical protein